MIAAMCAGSNPSPEKRSVAKVLSVLVCPAVLVDIPDMLAIRVPHATVIVDGEAVACTKIAASLDFVERVPQAPVRNPQRRRDGTGRIAGSTPDDCHFSPAASPPRTKTA